MVPRETVSFVFPESPDVSRVEVEWNIRTQGETKLTSFPRDHVKCFVIYLDFPLNNHVAKTNKQSTVRATTAQLYPGRDTFEFDQGHVTKNQSITELILSSDSNDWWFPSMIFGMHVNSFMELILWPCGVVKVDYG